MPELNGLENYFITVANERKAQAAAAAEQEKTNGFKLLMNLRRYARR